MNWMAIVLAAASGALAALVASLIVRKPKERGALYVFMFIVVFAILNAVGREFVLPKLTIASSLESAERELLALPAYQAMKLHDPVVYQGVLNDLKSGLERGLSEDEIVGQIKPRVVQMISQRIPIASDSSVANYMAVTVEEMRALNSKDPNLCYQFLFPLEYGAINVHKHLPAELAQKDLAALAAVIESSAKAPQPIPSEADVMEDLQVAVGALIDARGQEALTVMDKLHSPEVSKEVGCSVVADFYERVLDMPPERSGKVLRFLLAQP